MRPVAGVIDLALEAGEAVDIWHPRIRQAAGSEHDVFCNDGVAVGCGHLPRIAAFVEAGPIDAGVERNIGPHLEGVGDVAGVLHYLGLWRVAVAPVPYLLPFIGD